MYTVEKFSVEFQRKRINNINNAEKGNKKYYRRHRIRDYIPGQATYNLGDYPNSFGIKIIPHISTGYFQKTDPDFREEFLRSNYNSNYDLHGDYFLYTKCHAGSAEWREYLLPRTFAVLDEYGFDGIYNDWGYDGVNSIQDELIEKGINPRALSYFDMHYDPEIEDLLGTVYSQAVKIPMARMYTASGHPFRMILMNILAGQDLWSFISLW